MYSVCIKKDFAKRFHPSSFVIRYSTFDILRFAFLISCSFISEVQSSAIIKSIIVNPEPLNSHTRRCSMLEKNKELVNRYYQEAVGNLSGIEEVVAADFVDHHFPPGSPAGPEGVRQFYRRSWQCLQ